MPIYEFECRVCGCKRDIRLPLHRYEESQKCLVCDGSMKRLISRTNVNPDWEPFMHPNLEDEPILVQNRSHYSKLLSDRGLAGLYGEGKKSKWV